MKNKLLILQGIWTPFTQSSARQYASSACYFFLLSIPSSLFVCFSLLGLIIDADQQLVNCFLKIIPREFLEQMAILANEFHIKPTSGIISFSFISTIYSSAKGLSSLQEGLRAVGELPEKNFLHRRLIGVVIIFCAVPTSVCLLLLLGYAADISRLLFQILFQNISFHGFILKFKWIGLFFLQAIFLIIIYRLTYKTMRLSFIIRASALFSAICTSVSVLFAHVLKLCNTIEQHIGIVKLFAFMVWLRLMIICILYGAIFCRICYSGAYHPILLVKKAFKS